MRRRAWLAALPVAAFSACGIAAASGVRVNTTPSAPLGLWMTSHAEPDDLRRGDLVEVCLPDVTRKHLPRGECPNGSRPALKRIAGLMGDEVLVGPEGVAVGGVLASPPVPLDVGEDLPRVAAGAYRIPSDGVWLAGVLDNPRSLDSRFYGVVPVGSVLARTTPLLVVP